MTLMPIKRSKSRISSKSQHKLTCNLKIVYRHLSITTKGSSARQGEFDKKSLDLNFLKNPNVKINYYFLIVPGHKLRRFDEEAFFVPSQFWIILLEGCNVFDCRVFGENSKHEVSCLARIESRWNDL